METTLFSSLLSSYVYSYPWIPPMIPHVLGIHSCSLYKNIQIDRQDIILQERRHEFCHINRKRILRRPKKKKEKEKKKTSVLHGLLFTSGSVAFFSALI